MIHLSKRYTLFNTFLLLCVVISSFILYRTISRNPIQPATPDVDAFAIDVRGVQFNDLGQKRGEMQTPKFLHFTKGDSGTLIKPYLTLYSKDNKAPWLINAQTGKTFHGTQKIDLIGEVEIHQPESMQNQDTLITTSLLHIFPKQQLANTDKSVTLLQSGVKITSIGMQAYLDQKRVTLLSQARGLYDPLKAKPIHPLSQ